MLLVSRWRRFQSAFLIYNPDLPPGFPAEFFDGADVAPTCHLRSTCAIFR